MEEAAVAEEDNSTMTPSIILDSLIHCGVAGLEPRTYATAKGMLPLKPEENRWRRASFTIGTSYGTTPKLGGPHCTGLLLQLVRYITLHYPHRLTMGRRLSVGLFTNA